MSDFDAMKTIADRNGKIWSSGLGNMLELKRTSRGYEITLGISHEVGDRVAADKCVGAIYFIDSEEFVSTKAEISTYSIPLGAQEQSP